MAPDQRQESAGATGGLTADQPQRIARWAAREDNISQWVDPATYLAVPARRLPDPPASVVVNWLLAINSPPGVGGVSPMLRVLASEYDLTVPLAAWRTAGTNDAAMNIALFVLHEASTIFGSASPARRWHDVCPSARAAIARWLISDEVDFVLTTAGLIGATNRADERTIINALSVLDHHSSHRSARL